MRAVAGADGAGRERRARRTRALGLLDGDAEALSQVLTFRSIKGGGRLGAEKSAAEWAQLKKDWEWVTPAVRCCARLPAPPFHSLAHAGRPSPRTPRNCCPLART